MALLIHIPGYLLKLDEYFQPISSKIYEQLYRTPPPLAAHKKSKALQLSIIMVLKYRAFSQEFSPWAI